MVIRSYKLGESDKIVRIFTRGHGKRSGVAKGARKTTSRFGARLEPFTHLQVLMHEGRNMDIFRQTEIIDSFRELREDLDLFGNASAMAELIDSITQEHEPNPELFDLLIKGLDALRERGGHSSFVLPFFEFRTLALSGFELNVSSCSSCGGRLGGGDATFSLHLGGLVCEECRSKRPGDLGKLVRMDPGAVETLRWMSSSGMNRWPDSLPTQRAERELRFLMDRVLEHWMEREFKSHRVMKGIPGGPREDTRS